MNYGISFLITKGWEAGSDRKGGVGGGGGGRERRREGMLYHNRWGEGGGRETDKQTDRQTETESEEGGKVS